MNDWRIHGINAQIWDRCLKEKEEKNIHYHNIYWSSLIVNIDEISMQFLRDYSSNKTQYLNNLTKKLIISEIRIYFIDIHFISQKRISKFHITLIKKYNIQFLPKFEQIIWIEMWYILFFPEIFQFDIFILISL